MKRPPNFYAKMSLMSLIGLELLRLIDIITHVKYFVEHQLFLINTLAYMAIGFLFIPTLLRTNRQCFLGCFVVGIFSLGFMMLDPDFVPVLTSSFKPDIPLILLFTFSPALSTFLALFSYKGYKSLDATKQ